MNKYLSGKLVKASYITIISILLTVIMVLFTGKSPIDALNSFSFGVFGTVNGFAEIFIKATPLIFCALGISIAFKSGFFNIGAEGQICMGAIAATYVCIKLPGLPSFLCVLIAMLAAFILAGIWSGICGILKAKMGISETITTIMFNYIAINLVGLSVRSFLKDPASPLPQSSLIDSILPIILQPTRLHLGFIIALACVVLVWFILEKNTLGFEMMVVGQNERVAKCTGIPVIKNILLSAFISGGLAGLAGFSEVLGVQYKLLDGVSAGTGYTAILVALLAGGKPFHVLIVAIGFAFLQVGGNAMQRQVGIPASIVSILLGVIVLLVLAPKMIAKIQNAKEVA